MRLVVKNKSPLQSVLYLVIFVISLYFDVGILTIVLGVALALSLLYYILAKKETVAIFYKERVEVHLQDDEFETIKYSDIIYWTGDESGNQVLINFVKDEEERDLQIQTSNPLVLGFAMNHYLRKKNYQLLKYNEPISKVADKLSKFKGEKKNADTQ